MAIAISMSTDLETNMLTLSGRGFTHYPPHPHLKIKEGVVLGPQFAIYELNILNNGGHIQANPATKANKPTHPSIFFFGAPVVTKLHKNLIQTLLEPFQSE